MHHAVSLDLSEITRRRRIPVTCPSRTLRDLRRTAPPKTFARALREAEYLGLAVGELEPDHTRSELEARFLALLRRHRLPQPYVNVRIGGSVVDFAWPQERLVVELDGYRAHRTRSAFESDRARDVALKLRGYEVIRLTWRQIAAESKGTADLIRRLLGRHQLGLSA